jgi:hypothetical protein
MTPESVDFSPLGGREGVDEVGEETYEEGAETD